MKRKRMTGLLAVIAFLLPLITGMFGFGETSYADAPTDEQKVNVTLHKKKMDQFPTEDIQNTGEEMSEFNQYEGLPGVTFKAWDISDDFYSQLNAEVSATASAEEYAAAVKKLMKEFVFTESKATLKDTKETNDSGLAVFNNLDKRSADGTYKVYFFEELAKSGVQASATPLILVLPVVKNNVENRDIHLYPKNKVKGEIDKVLVDENGNPLYNEEKPEEEPKKKDRYDYEVGKKVYYRASFTIPNQIGEIINKDSGQQTRYTKLIFKDAVSENGLKFEGIDRITIGDSSTSIKDDFFTHGVPTYMSTADPYNEKAGFTITMNLNDAVSGVDDTNFNTSKTTAEYLSQYGGKTINIYYAVSFTEKTPVDVDVNNKFEVDLTHDGETQHEEDGDVPPIVTGGKKFLKHEDGKETQALDGATFIVIKKDSGKDYYLTYKDNTVTWTEIGADKDYTNATRYTSENGGKITVSGLAFGTYYLREIEAPNGFQLLTDDKDFIISKDSFKDEATLKVANVSKGGFLPSTGGKGIIAFLAVGMALMLFAFYKYRRIQHAAN